MDLKTLFAVVASVIGIIAFVPYFRDLLAKKTQPHPFTWLILAITQGSAVGIMLQNGGEKGSISLAIGVFLIIVIFFLSLPRSKKIIAKSDIFLLFCALVAIFIWWFLENPLVSIFLLSAIDASSYVPTFRKSYLQPRSETASTWAAFAVSNIFAMLALGEYNLETLTYLVTITLANIALVLFLLVRRRQVR